MTRHVHDIGSARGGRRARAVVGAAASAALALIGACFSPAPYTEHLCRECASECPDGLICHQQRCVRVCDASCVGDFQCDQESGACLPTSGAEQCPTRAVRMALCVGKPVEGGTTVRSDSNSEEPWVVLDSRLPEGVSFDPDTGTLNGTPKRVEPGSLTARHGEPGSVEVSLDLEVLASESCASIETTEFNWCSGVSQSERLVASPAGHYEWRIESPVPGLSQQGDQLSGRIEAPGSYELRVELRESDMLVDVATVALIVSDCGPPGELVPGAPTPLDIATPPALPDACEGAAYAASFEATGGTPAYRWSLESAPLGLTLEEASGRLLGTPLESGDFQLAVSVDDSAGNHDDVSVSLHIGNASDGQGLSGGCGSSNPDIVSGGEGTCGVGGNPPCARPPLEIATTDVGVACAGENFSARLQASGGGGGYRWNLLSDPSDPSGLVLDRNGLLHGVPSDGDIGEHNIAVSVMSTLTDTPTTANVKLEIAACEGLVFITEEPSSDRLFYVSPGTGSSRELSEGLLAVGESVHTFAFALDGAHLAFDVRGDGGASRLYRVDLASLDVRPPTFAGDLPAGASLIDYRWSLDGGSLAATFRAENEVFLAVSPAGGGTGSSVEISGRYVSNLFWAGDRICYVGAGLRAPFLSVLCHAVATDGVQNQAPFSGIFNPTDLRQDLILSSDDGFLAILATEIHADFLAPTDPGTGVRHTSQVFSPALHRAAGLSTTQASVGEVVTSHGTPEDPSVPALLARLEPCDGIDAWSSDERWLACRDGDALAIHQLGTDGALLVSARVDDSAGYAGEEFRRLWAPDGQWYAYSASGELRVVPTGTAPRSRSIVAGGAPSSYAGLSTDAAGRRIFYHHGTDLDVVDTTDLSVRRAVNAGVLLPDPAACVEAYLEEGPRLWCGGASIPSFVFPAPRAPRVAFVDRQNQLYVVDGVDVMDVAGVGGSRSAPRLVSSSSVKCTMDSGDTECDNFVQWVPRASP